MAGPIGTKDLAYQAVEPYQEGLTVKNVSGGSLAVGDLVYVNGTTTSPATGTDPVATVTKADADAAGAAKTATYVVTKAMASNAFGKVGKYLVARGVNTNSYTTVGDPVYLSTTAGASTPTIPTLGNVQIVGYVAVKSATVGIIVYDLRSNPVVAEGNLAGSSFANTTVGAAVTPGGASRALTAAEFGAPVRFVLQVADAASGNADFTGVPYKVLITGVSYIKTGAGGNAGNSITLHNGITGNAITDGLNNASDTGTDYAATLDDAFTTVAAGATLRAVTVRAGGNNAAILVVDAIRVA